jgi:DNA invertase Pin-like site-specific DNA recombinase
MGCKVVSYKRVSTQKQGADGLGIEAQNTAIANHLRMSGCSLVAEFVEVESGKNSKRPELLKALAACRIYGATLVVAKLDRLSRNSAFLNNLMESSVDFIACDNPNANKLTVRILAAVAEDELTNISNRTRAALAAAKSRGVALGGHRVVKATGESWKIPATAVARGCRESIETRKANAAGFTAALLPAIEDLKANGAVTLRSIAKGLNDRGIKTSRGGQWSAVQVQRILTRAA